MALTAITATLPLFIVGQAQAQTYNLTTVATFTGAANGGRPYDGLAIDSGGNLYGTTFIGGASNDGTVFKIASGTNTITTLATFTGTGNGANPQGGPTLDANGNLYGTTGMGGANNSGTVFEMSVGTSTLTTVATFTFAGGGGAQPYGSVTLDSSGNIYGTTVAGGSKGAGIVYKIVAGTNTITTLASFTGTNGSQPTAGVVIDGNGNLFGTTQGDSTHNDGTVYKIVAGTNTITTLATFTGAANGAVPYAGVTIDPAGNLYGTTESGGANNQGTVFKIAAGTSTLTTLVTFNGTNGAAPFSGITLDAAGNLFGTTIAGGSQSDGVVYEIPVGAMAPTTIATFNGTNGSVPIGNLTLDGRGDIYGTTVAGGSNNNGTVFELTPVNGAAPEPGSLSLIAAMALIVGTRSVRVTRRGLR